MRKGFAYLPSQSSAFAVDITGRGGRARALVKVVKSISVYRAGCELKRTQVCGQGKGGGGWGGGGRVLCVGATAVALGGGAEKKESSRGERQEMKADP